MNDVAFSNRDSDSCSRYVDRQLPTEKAMNWDRQYAHVDWLSIFIYRFPYQA